MFLCRVERLKVHVLPIELDAVKFLNSDVLLNINAPRIFTSEACMISKELNNHEIFLPISLA